MITRKKAEILTKWKVQWAAWSLNCVLYQTINGVCNKCIRFTLSVKLNLFEFYDNDNLFHWSVNKSIFTNITLNSVPFLVQIRKACFWCRNYVTNVNKTKYSIHKYRINFFVICYSEYVNYVYCKICIPQPVSLIPQTTNFPKDCRQSKKEYGYTYTQCKYNVFALGNGNTNDIKGSVL